MPDSKLALITPVGGERPDNSLPDIEWPPQVGHPPYPSNGLPEGGNVGHPDHPIVIPPPPTVDAGLPFPPSIWPGVPIHGGPGIDNTLPGLPPGTVWPPLPPVIKFPVVALVWIPGLGYRWTVLSPTINPTPPRPTPK